MKIKMISMAFTQNGLFEKGDILTDEKYSPEFLRHLVEAAHAAEWLDYETKVVDVAETKEEKPVIKKKPGRKKKPRSASRPGRH